MASNDSATETILSKRNKAIISALSKRLSFDPKGLSSETVNGHDIKSLFSNILQLSGDGAPLKNNDEVMKWVEFANGFPAEAKDCHSILKGFNESLTPKSVLLGDGLNPSEADIIVFAALHSFVSCLSNSDMQKLPNVVRWMDYIQNKEDFGEVFKKISVEKTGFEPHVPKHVDKLEVDPNIKKSGQGSKNVEKVEVNSNSNKIVAEKKAAGDNKASEEKKKKPEKESVEKDTEASVSLLNIQVGVIRKAWKHPSADSLLVEEIDLGGGNLRQVVSGLAKYFTPVQLTNRHVVLVTNVKPGKLRDVMSAGLVLCASSQDHTVVEPLLPPEGAKLGERISFSGHDGKPEDVLNPKKKQLEKITPKGLSSETVNGHDIKSLFSNILQLSGDGAPLKNNDEVMKWVEFANGFPAEAKDCHSILKGFNESLTPKSVLLGDGLNPSEADIIVFAALHSFVSCLSNSDMQKLPNVVRWMDYIQNKEDFGEVFKKISVEKTGFEPHVPKHVDKLEVDPNIKKSGQGSKNVEKVEVNSNSNKIVAEKKAAGDNKASEEKKKKPEKESVEKDTEASVSLLNIQVGVIRKAWKHPSADSLLVEEIDLGGGNLRQVVSGLAKYFTPVQLTNRHVVLVTNVKPGKLRDVMSAGLVLCASSQDHTVVEPLLPPEGAKLGERISFSGHDGKPEDVLNPKKKQLEKITPHLYTNENGVATYKGIPFMTSAGPCTSSIPSAGIK